MQIANILANIVPAAYRLYTPALYRLCAPAQTPAAQVVTPVAQVVTHALFNSHRGSFDATRFLSFGAVSGSIAGAGSWAGGGSRPDPSAGTGVAYLLVSLLSVNGHVCSNGRGCAAGSNCRDFRAETRWSLNPGEAAKIWVHQRGKAASRQLLPAAAQSTVPAPALDRSRSAASCSDMASMMKRTSSSCATSSRRPEPFVAAASRASVRVMAQAQQPAPVNAASKQMFTAAQAPSRSVVTRVAAAEAPASTSTSTKVRAGAWHWKLWTWA